MHLLNSYKRLRMPRRHLAMFRQLAQPEKKIFDLNSNPGKRLRTDLQHGEMPTLTTNMAYVW